MTSSVLEQQGARANMFHKDFPLTAKITKA